MTDKSWETRYPDKCREAWLGHGGGAGRHVAHWCHQSNFGDAFFATSVYPRRLHVCDFLVGKRRVKRVPPLALKKSFHCSITLLLKLSKATKMPILDKWIIP
jgi:hypothetical protein